LPYISPDQYQTTPAEDLLHAAAHGFIGFDQRLIHALVDRPERTLPGILSFLRGHRIHPDLIPDFVAIFHNLNTPEAAEFYIAAIRGTLDDISDDLTEAVVTLGAPMLEPLLALYHDVAEEQSSEIAFMLAGLGVRDQRIFDLLLERLEYEAGDGALSLSLYGDPAAIPHIERILLEVPETDEHLRHELQSAIRQIEAAQPPIAPEPFDIFKLYAEEAGPNFGALSAQDRLSLLSDTPPDVRAEAAASFRHEELSVIVRDRLLRAAKLDPDPNVRGRAWEALAANSGEPEIHRSLIEAARNAPLEERTGAVVALASGEEVDAETLALIEALYSVPEARAKTIEAMWKSLDPRFRQYIVKHLDDPDPLVRHHAIYGIGYLGLGSEVHRLTALFEDDDFRHDALLAYALAVPAETGRSRMKALFRRIDQLAGGLTDAEAALVEQALDERLIMRGMKPVFEAGADAEPEPTPKAPVKVGRNDPCPCGSGKKYKKCHGG
jgi:HEAT repeat protein